MKVTGSDSDQIKHDMTSETSPEEKTEIIEIDEPKGKENIPEVQQEVSEPEKKKGRPRTTRAKKNKAKKQSDEEILITDPAVEQEITEEKPKENQNGINATELLGKLDELSGEQTFHQIKLKIMFL